MRACMDGRVADERTRYLPLMSEAQSATSQGSQVTLKEAAALLGTTPDNLRGAIRRGSLSATKPARDWMVTEQEVEKYRKEHKR